MSDDIDYFQMGQDAAKHFYGPKSPYYGIRYGRPEDIAKLYLSYIRESLTQMVTPLPKSRQEWLAGFTKQKAEMFAELAEENKDG